jgi:hypothetical protein
MPYTFGNVSKSTFLNGPESHKLHLEFDATANINVGQPCKMHADGGKVSPCVDGDAEQVMVGISIHPGKSAYGDKVVLATRGYAVIYAQSAAAVTPGPVAYKGYDGTTKYNIVATLAAVTTPAEAAALPASLHFGWALDKATAASQIIRVLVKD